MDYHIYLDGEKCDTLTGAENARLRKEAKRDARTWCAFIFAHLAWSVRFLAFYLRMLGLVGGLLVLMLAICAPLFQQDIQSLSGEEIALLIQQVGFSLSILAGLFAAACLLYAPRMFGIPNIVFEREFQRRVRLLKNIYRYGQLEIIPYPS